MIISIYVLNIWSIDLIKWSYTIVFEVLKSLFFKIEFFIYIKNLFLPQEFTLFLSHIPHSVLWEIFNQGLEKQIITSADVCALIKQSPFFHCKGET